MFRNYVSNNDLTVLTSNKEIVKHIIILLIAFVIKSKYLTAKPTSIFLRFLSSSNFGRW